MITINKKKLKIIDDGIMRSGSYGSIYKCTLGNKTYAYKKFYNKNFLNGKRKKFDQISKVCCKNFIVPQYLVDKDGYLADFCDGKSFRQIKSSSDKISVLKKAKELILLLHEDDVIHGDISMNNIMVGGNEVYITDFDNSSCGKYTMNEKEASFLAQSFIRKYGITPELDIFLFNTLTYYVMNNCFTSAGIICGIRDNNCGIFTDKDQIEICNSILLESPKPTKRFLIDTITDVKKI